MSESQNRCRTQDGLAEVQQSLIEGQANSNPQTVESAGVRFPGEDGGRSLAQMAQRDLDAALQLLADRAQYITGATGAAIALRRNGMDDMLCRASTGSNAPELGALLSTEFGLSGESVRTRRTLRCDDAERDARVNREVCRRLGIASVVVMPVVNDDEVLGVFELFSGQANAFGERDLSAMQRLSQMVETAVRLARATETLPERLQANDTSVPEAALVDVGEEILDVSSLETPVVPEAAEEILPYVEAAAEPASAEAAVVEPEHPWNSASVSAAAAAPALAPIESPVMAPIARHEPEVLPSIAAQSVEATAGETTKQEEVAAPKKKLFWSAAMDIGQAGKSGPADQSLVPPVMRGLRKCEACGFPVSAGRVLCVECEERRFRGQAKRPLPTGAAAAAAGNVAVARAPSTTNVPVPHKMAVEPLAPEGGSPELVLSAGMATPPSWIATHKVTVGIVLAVVASIAVVVLFR
jgi:GAF domain-containing protein